MRPHEIEPTVHISMKPTYQQYRKAVLTHIKTRREEHAFESIDEEIVELLARYYADWLYLEQEASQSPKQLARYADALNKLAGSIRDLWNELILTPKARRQIMREFKEELEKNEELQNWLKKLMGQAQD